MPPTRHVLALASRLKGRIDRARRLRRIERLRSRGMFIGSDVNFPESLYVDEEYCALISIGNSTWFGPECMILAHHAGPQGALAARLVAPVTLHQSCHIGARTIILPGAQLGPRTLVAANSVVMGTLPPDTVCAGRPARPFSSMDQYLETHRRRIQASPVFEYDQYSIQFLTPARRAELVEAAQQGDVYIVGGRSAQLRGSEDVDRTPFGDYSPAPPDRTWRSAGPDAPQHPR